MNRRTWMKALAATALVRPRVSMASESKGRFRAAICAYSFRDQFKAGSMTYADLIRMAADLGADGVDLTAYWLTDTTDQTLFPLRKLAYRSAVAICTIGTGASMAQPTPQLQAAEVEGVRKWLAVAEKLGASHMRVFGGDIPKGASEDQAVAWAVETLKRCAVEAAKKGITLGVEDDGGLTTNADRTMEIIRKTDSPWVGINLDVGNFPDNPYTQIEMCAPYATNVHLKSQVQIARKNQPADWPRILKILGNAGYHGYLAIEYELTDDPRTAVAKLVARLRETIRSA
ncbi:MAG: sugar phosphate isomerase/epimerase [Acidobacteriia bacterium]|nr:sugar phosphate isomerase/epimerase [Terriglobia bacterium]